MIIPDAHSTKQISVARLEAIAAQEFAPAKIAQLIKQAANAGYAYCVVPQQTLLDFSESQAVAHLKHRLVRLGYSVSFDLARRNCPTATNADFDYERLHIYWRGA